MKNVILITGKATGGHYSLVEDTLRLKNVEVFEISGAPNEYFPEFILLTYQLISGA